MIYGERIKQVRELMRWTQTELAEVLGVKQSFVAKVEGDRASLPPELVERLALTSGFLPTFFSREPESDFPAGSLLFRAHASMKVKEEDEIYRYAQITFGVLKVMLGKRKFKELPVHLPTVTGEDPSTAANLTRSEVGLGPDGPVPNLTNVLEKAGVLILALPKPFKGRDAFSLWSGFDRHRPVMVLAGGKLGDRLRFNMAHELGHLVMHKPIVNAVREIERQAQQFAAEFLMPEKAMRLEIVPPVTLDTFAALKPRWGVSIQALIFRAKELDILSPRKYTYLFQQLSMRGWRTREPRIFDVPLEKPRLVRQIAEMIYGVSVRYDKLAEDVGMQESLVRSIIEAHATRNSQPQIERAQGEPSRAPVVNFHSRKVSSL